MAQTVLAHFDDHVRNMPEAAALMYRGGGEWRTLTWKDYADLTSRLGRTLMKLGVQPGQVVAIWSLNRWEWVVADVAAMRIGAVPAGIYPTNPPELVAYILNHSQAPVLVVEDEALLAKLLPLRPTLTHLKHIIMLNGRSAAAGVLSWKEALEAGSTMPQTAVEGRVKAIQPSSLATLIYTSGTTGPPKAVMLSHSNLVTTADILLQLAEVYRGDCTLSYLPLSHIAEQMNSIHIPLAAGGTVWFAEAMDKVRDGLLAARPQLFFAVPRVWEKFQGAMEGRLEAMRGFQAALVKAAGDTAEQYHQLKEDGAKIPVGVSLKYKTFSALVYGKLKAALGLDRARYFVSGAAPISPSTLKFFRRLDIPIREIYGQSEGSGVASFNTHEKARLGTVGHPLPRMEVKIAEDGEILVKGPNIFMGYLGDQKATAETLKAGWLHSGDVGEFDKDGFLKITDRKKDLIITAGGKNIAPQNVEQALKVIHEVSNVVVYGDRQKYLVALVTLDPERALHWAQQRDLDARKAADVARHPDFVAYVDQSILTINEQLAQYETVKRFKVLEQDFTIEAGEITPTMKLKRKFVNERYKAEIRSLYGEDWIEHK